MVQIAESEVWSIILRPDGAVPLTAPKTHQDHPSAPFDHDIVPVSEIEGKETLS